MKLVIGIRLKQWSVQLSLAFDSDRVAKASDMSKIPILLSGRVAVAADICQMTGCETRGTQRVFFLYFCRLLAKAPR